MLNAGKSAILHILVHTKDQINGSGVGLSRDDSNNGVYAGLGGQYQLSDKVALSHEYERNGKERDFRAKANAITMGARYSFSLIAQ